MEQVTIIYQNNIGVALNSIDPIDSDLKKAQLIFRNTGLTLDYYQLFLFSKQLKSKIDNPRICHKCDNIKTCQTILLETPLEELKFAMSLDELNQMHDLIIGTIFQLDLKSILKYFKINN